MHISATPHDKRVLSRRGKALGLTVGLLCLDTAGPGLAHGPAGPAGPSWMPPVHTLPLTGPLHSHMTGGGNWGQATQVFHNIAGHSNSAALPGLTSHSKTNFSVGLAGNTPQVGINTTEFGQTGHNLALDLTSSNANIMLGSKLFGTTSSVTINVGGTQQSYKPGSVVTAGEYVAISQVLKGSSQAVTLSASGSAIGGTFSLNAVDKGNVTNLTIPTSVTALDYVSKNSTLRLSGDLTNYGSIDAVSLNNKSASGTISAADITNESGGIITSIQPGATSGTAGGATSSSLDLTLQATNNLSNAGSITSSGALL